MVNVRKSAGFLLLELVIAIVMITAILSFAFSGDRQQLSQIASSFAETKASRLLSGKLEQLRDPKVALELGTQRFELPPQSTKGLLSPIGELTVRRVADGVFEILAKLTWRSPGSSHPRSFELTTWVNREAGS